MSGKYEHRILWLRKEQVVSSDFSRRLTKRSQGDISRGGVGLFHLKPDFEALKPNFDQVNIQL